MVHPASLDIETLISDCEIRRQRRSGPGGQHRNKVETAIFIKHLPTGIEAGATERRSQEQNRLRAIGRLRLKLAVEHREALSETYTPSRLWKQRTSGGRLLISAAHDDYPALLAEAFDVLALEEYAIAPAATRLGCSSSQLVKLARSNTQAWTLLNRQRQRRGLPPLR